MKATEAIQFFGSASELARRLKVSRAAPSNWVKRGNRVPELPARRLHEMTRGQLRFDSRAYE